MLCLFPDEKIFEKVAVHHLVGMTVLLILLNDLFCLFEELQSPLCLQSPMVSVGTQVSLMRKQGGHSLSQLFSLYLVEAEDGWSRISLSKAGQFIQQWCLPCNFQMVKSYAVRSMHYAEFPL